MSGGALRWAYLWAIMLLFVASGTPLFPAFDPLVHGSQPIYTYFDERGTLVATDRWDHIPERYRARVTVSAAANEGTGGQRRKDLSRTGRVERGVIGLVDQLPAKVIPGLSTYQSVILILAVLIILLSYGSAKLTRSTFLRLLMPWTIGLTAIGAVYFMFISDLSDTIAMRSSSKSTGSLVHQFQQQGQRMNEQKQDRLKQVEEIHSREEPSP